MTTKTETKTTEPPKLSPRVRGLCLPPDIDLPPAVAEANQTAIQAAAELTEAEAEAAEAGRESRQAALHDQAAATAAVEAGESFVNLTAPQKAERVETTKVRVLAAQRLVKLRARELRQAIRDDANYVRDRETEYNLAAGELAETLEQLPELWARLLQARATYSPARRIADEAWSGPVREDVLSEERLRARLEKANKRRRARGGRDLPSFEESVAALAVLLEREAA